MGDWGNPIDAPGDVAMTAEGGDTQEEIMNCLGLGGWLEDFDSIVRTGYQAYRSYSPEHLLEHDRRASAACIYCHMTEEAERRFSNRHGIVGKNIRGQKLWIIGQEAIIRFKKMDEDGKTANYPTKQAKDFDAGKDLPGIPKPAARLSVGYFQDETETEIKHVMVSRPIGRSVEWCSGIVLCEDGRWTDITRQHQFEETKIRKKK
jgi:hypothetical protein